MDKKTVSKKEIQEWINFLYKDLLQDDIYIGGYYFNFKQLESFKKQKNQIDKKYKKKQNILNILLNKPKQIKQIKQINESIIKITTKNRFNEIKTFPCTEDEFYFVFEELQKAKEDIEHFKQFLLEELEITKSEDLSYFMIFINDLLKDLRNKFSGQTYSIIL